jgi:HEAT repeat protein
MGSGSNAARALGILRAKGGLRALMGALKSKNSRLMFESLIALQKIRDRSAGPRVVFLVRDMDEEVQIAAIQTAGILGAKEAVPELKRVLEKQPGKRVRRAALVALAQIVDPGSRQMFLSLLSDKDEEARAAAAEGLGRLGNEEDRAPLQLAWSEERRMSPRLALGFALVMLGDRETGDFSPLGYLINTLNQKSWRGVAQPYLSELALRTEPRQAVYSALDRVSTRDEKTGIAQALAGCGSRDAVPPLERLAKDEDPAVAREALRALRIVRGSAQ